VRVLIETSRLGTGKSLTFFTSRLGTGKWQTFFYIVYTAWSTENAEFKKLKKKHEVQVCMLTFWFGEYSGGALGELLKPSDMHAL